MSNRLQSLWFLTYHCTHPTTHNPARSGVYIALDNTIVTDKDVLARQFFGRQHSHTHNTTVSRNEEIWVDQVTPPPPRGRTRGGEGHGGGGSSMA